jgi:hypothetical protein
VPEHKRVPIERPTESLGARAAGVVVPSIIAMIAFLMVASQITTRPFGTPWTYGIGGSIGLVFWSVRLFIHSRRAAEWEEEERLDERWNFRRRQPPDPHPPDHT